MRTAIHPVTVRDASYVFQNLRDDDLVEASCQRPTWQPIQAAQQVAVERYAWVAKLDGTPACVFGAQHMSATTVLSWALGTNQMVRTIPMITRFMLGPLRAQVIADGYRWTEARSITTHVTAHRWLERMGFRRIVDLPDYGKNGENFALFRASVLGY